MFIQTEATPNPATLKFLPGRTVLATGTLDMRDPAQAARSPLAERLFEINGVDGVFYGSDFITVTKGDGEWQQLKPAVLGAIMEHFMSGAPLVRSDAEAGEAPGRGGGVLRSGGRRDGRDHQGPDRDARAPGGGQRRRRHHVPRLQGRRRLSRHEGRLLGLPVLDRHAAPRHPEPAAPFRAGRRRGAADLTNPSLSCRGRAVLSESGGHGRHHQRSVRRGSS